MREFIVYHKLYCQQHHKRPCTKCETLLEIANYIVQEEIVKLSVLWRAFFPNVIYESDKAMLKILKLPVAIFRQKGPSTPLHVTELCPEVNYQRLIQWLDKLTPESYLAV